MAGIVSAVLLCLTAALALVYGPLTDSTPFASSVTRSATGGMGVADQHSAPVIPKRPFVVVDWRATKAATLQGEGSPDAALRPGGIDVPKPDFAQPRAALPLRADFRPQVSAYGARAPPAYS